MSTCTVDNYDEFVFTKFKLVKYNHVDKNNAIKKNFKRFSLLVPFGHLFKPFNLLK